MWNYTAYMLWKYSEIVGESFNLRDFVNFVFVEVGRKQRIFFHDGERDLYGDLEYLKDLGAITLKSEGNTVTIRVKKDVLSRIAKEVEEFPKRVKSDVLKDYINRINRALSDLAYSQRVLK